MRLRGNQTVRDFSANTSGIDYDIWKTFCGKIDTHVRDDLVQRVVLKLYTQRGFLPSRIKELTRG